MQIEDDAAIVRHANNSTQLQTLAENKLEKSDQYMNQNGLKLNKRRNDFQ